jgi:fibronectin type 3 domain-containing protein
VDTTAEPGKQNMYTIIALDDAGLESDPAPPIKAGRSDAALKPAITWKEPLLDKDSQQVTLRWSYDKAAVKSYQIFKSINGDATKLYRTITGNTLQWMDRPLKTENKYTYRMVVVFENGARSALSKELIIDFK